MFQKMGGGGEMGHGEKPLPREESHEVHHEGTVGHVMEAVRRAAPNAIVFVSGLEQRDYDESIGALAHEKGITLVDKNDGQTIDATRTSLDERITGYPNQKIVANIPKFLRTAFFGPDGTTKGEEGEHLFTPSHDPMGELLEWIEKEGKESAELDGEDALLKRFEGVFKMIRSLSGGSNRPIQLTLPASSPLVLAYLTFAKYGNLSYGSILKMRKEYPLDDHHAVASILLEPDKKPRVFFGDREVE